MGVPLKHIGWMALLLVCVITEPASAELFRRPLFRPFQPVFRSRTVSRQRVTPRRTVSSTFNRVVNQPGNSCAGGQCIPARQSAVNTGQKFFRDDFRNIVGTRTLTANGGILFERDIRNGDPIAQLVIDPYTGLLKRRPLVRFPQRADRFTKGDIFIPSGHWTTQHVSGALVRDLVEFYDRSLTKFRTNVAEALLDERSNFQTPGSSRAFQKAQNELLQVTNFLRAYGNIQGVQPGTLRVDLKNTTFPEDLAKWAEATNLPGGTGEEKAKIAALNYLFNTLSSKNPTPFRAGSYADTKELNLVGFLDQLGLNRLMHNDPYNCGVSGQPMRLDYLIARAMDPEIYYESVGFADNFDIFAREFGVGNRPDVISFKAKTAVNRGDDHPSKNVILADYRVRGWEFDERGNVRQGDQVPGVFYRSYDNDVIKVGQSINQATNPGATTKENFSFAAGEIIGRNANGFMNFYLHAAGGARANDAPGTIAHGKNPYGGTAVITGASCLECHNVGQIGYNTEPGKPYDPNLSRNQDPMTERIKKDNSDFVDTLQRAQAYIPTFTSTTDEKTGKTTYQPKYHDGLRDGDKREEPAAVIPKIIRKYYEDMSLEQVAKELFGQEYSGDALEQAKANIRAVARERIDEDVITDEKGNETKLETINRRDFELYYCTWKYGQPIKRQNVPSGAVNPFSQPGGQPHSRSAVPFNVHGSVGAFPSP